MSNISYFSGMQYFFTEIRVLNSISRQPASTDILIFQLLLLSGARNCICKLPLHTQSKRRRQSVRVFVAITSFPSKSFFFFSLSISSLSDVFALSN